MSTDLLEKLRKQEEELKQLREEIANLKQEEEDYSDWCSIDMGAFTTNLAYCNPIFTKEGSSLVRDFENLSEELQHEICDMVLEEGEVNDRVIEHMEDVTKDLWYKVKEVMNIIRYKGEERQVLAKSDKFQQWLHSIETRYGGYIFAHGYDYWLERGVDLTKPVKLCLRYYAQDKYDITNLSKHFIDYLYVNWNNNDTKKWFEVEYPVLDDDVIYWLDERKIGRSDDDYYSSRIFWKFEQVEEELDVRTKADIKNKKIKDFNMSKSR